MGEHKHFLRKAVVPGCSHTVKYPVSAKIWGGGAHRYTREIPGLRFTKLKVKKLRNFEL